MADDRELGDYLRRRRSMVSPEEAGLPVTGHRRVPGLRREEVAGLVGLSADYYVRLEQGRGGRPSTQVLDALARVLRLGPAERAHLEDLGRPRRRSSRPHRPREPRPQVARLVAGIPSMAAVVMTACTQVIAWNPLAAALIADFDALPEVDRNMARLIFLDPLAAARHSDWEGAARDTVGILRLEAGRHPEAPDLTALVGELATRSEPFSRLWATHHVHLKTHGTKDFSHPVVGALRLEYETMLFPDDEHQMLVTYGAQAGSPDADTLALLGSLDATGASPNVR